MNGRVKLYRALLRLYPRSFRQRFEAEMLSLFAERAEAAEPTFAGQLRFWSTIVADLLRSAARERLPERGPLSLSATADDARQAWRAVTRAPHSPVRKGPTMAHVCRCLLGATVVFLLLGCATTGLDDASACVDLRRAERAR